MLKGKRKFIAFWGVIILGAGAFVTYLVVDKPEIAALGALYALFGTALKFFNDSNLKEHENGNGQPK